MLLAVLSCSLLAGVRLRFLMWASSTARRRRRASPRFGRMSSSTAANTLKVRKDHNDMTRNVRIVLAQLYSSPSLERNVASLKDALERARSEGADIIIFPEFYVQGVLADAPEKVFTSEDGDAKQQFAALAKEFGIDIVIGTLVEKVQEHDERSNIREQKTYNTAYYFDKSGNTLGQYRKRNLCVLPEP